MMVNNFKILVYCYEYPPIGGGAGNALSCLAREWVRLGAECTIVSSGFGALNGEVFEEGVRVIRLPVGRADIGRGRMVEMLRFMWLSSRSAKKVCKRLKPDVSVAFMAVPSGAACYWLSKVSGLPFVTELRGGDVPGFDPNSLGIYHKMTRPIIRRMWEQSLTVIANSHGLAQLARKTCTQIPIQVVPNGVDATQFVPTASRTMTNGLHGVYVGRLVESQKKVSMLIKACSQIPNMRLSLVGMGPDESMYRKMASELEAGKITFHGWVPKSILVKILQSADIYVSASAWEGMPNAALEAMACGLPLLLSKAAGHEELIGEVGNGRLVSSHTLECWVSALVDCIQNREQLTHMGLRGRSHVLKHHDWVAIAQTRLAIYKQMLSERGANYE